MTVTVDPASAGVGSIMAGARALTAEETHDLSAFTAGGITVGLPAVSTDPLDELVGRLRPTVGAAVDALQVAAVLEAQGISDRAARVEYGYSDVFRLAEEVYRRLGPDRVATARPARPIGDRATALRDVGHGALYLLPTAIFPAVLAMVGPAVVPGLVLAGGLGWVLAGTASWAAYRLLGRGHPAAAGQVLRWTALGGPPLAAGLGFGVVAGTGGGYPLVALVVGQVVYQMASTLLMFYRRELWLLAAMAPGAALGVGYLLVGPALLPAAIGAGVASVVLAFGLAVAETTTAVGPAEGGADRRPADQAPYRALGADLRTWPWVAGYAALSAAYLLHAQTPYLLGRFDIAAVAAPLIVGMGIVEWQVRRFGDLAAALPAQVRLPAQFRARVWRLLFAGVGRCVAAVGLLAVPLLAAVAWWRSVSPAGVVMAAAYAVLAGTYFLGFLLAERARYGWLCGALGVATAMHLTARHFVAGPSGPLADAGWYLGSAALLHVLLLAGLAPVVGQVARYRSS